MARPKRNLSEELKNQNDFVEGVLALVAKHFGRKRKEKNMRGRVTKDTLIIGRANGEEFERA